MKKDLAQDATFTIMKIALSKEKVLQESAPTVI